MKSLPRGASCWSPSIGCSSMNGAATVAHGSPCRSLTQPAARSGARVDLRAQLLCSPGVSGATPVSANGSFRAQVISGAASLGYTLHRERTPTLRAAAALSRGTGAT
jgi:hypothetical protein